MPPTPQSPGPQVRFRIPSFPQDLTIYSGELRGILGSSDSPIAQIFTVDDKEHKIPWTNLLALNPELAQSTIENVRENLAFLLRREELLVSGGSVSLTSQGFPGDDTERELNSTLGKNIRFVRIVGPNGRLLGSTALSTAPGGYSYKFKTDPKIHTNEDGIEIIAKDDGALMVIVDGVGSSESAKECTKILLEEISKNPNDIILAINNAIARFPEKGAVAFLIADLVEGEPLKVYRMGNPKFRLNDTEGSLLYESDQYLASNLSAFPQSGVEYFNFLANNLQAEYINKMCALLEDKLKIQKSEGEELIKGDSLNYIVRKMIAKLYVGNLASFDNVKLNAIADKESERFRDLFDRERALLAGKIKAESNLGKIMRTREQEEGLNRCVSRILTGARPVVIREPHFYPLVACVIYNSLSNKSEIVDLDVHEGPVVKRGYWGIATTDGVEGALKPHDRKKKGDEIMVMLRAAISKGNDPGNFCLEIGNLVDERIMDTNSGDSEAIANVYLGDDNTTLGVYRVGI